MADAASRPVVTTEVRNGDVVLAATDHGGSGPALVLMHGAGMDQASLLPLVECLRGTFHIVTFDFRGHGGSDRAPWTFSSAVQDLESVAAAYGLGVPSVGGHSLGGMVAAGYGVQHPTCPGVINIDGHGRGRVEQYVGCDGAEVRQWWDAHQRRVDRLTSGPGAAALKGLYFVLRQRPTATAEAARQVMAEVDALDLFELYRQLQCPLLVFNATAQENRGAMKLLVGKGMPLLRAYREGLGKDLAALATETSSVEVATVDATHMLIRTHPELVGRHITAFLEAQG